MSFSPPSPLHPLPPPLPSPSFIYIHPAGSLTSVPFIMLSWHLILFTRCKSPLIYYFVQIPWTLLRFITGNLQNMCIIISSHPVVSITVTLRFRQRYNHASVLRNALTKAFPLQFSRIYFHFRRVLIQLRKASSCLSVRVKQLDLHSKHFHEIDYFSEICRENSRFITIWQE